MYSKKMMNGFFKLVMGIASLFDLKLAIVLRDHEILIETIAEDEKEGERYFDPEHYLNGNLYIDGKANPVDIKEMKEDVQLISSTKYERFFDIDILEKIAQVSKGSISIKGWGIMLALLSVSTILNVFLFFMMAG